MLPLSTQTNLPVTAAGFVFDCDGLLTDTESLWTGVLIEWMSTNGLQELSIEVLAGKAIDDICDFFADASGRDFHKIQQELSDTYIALIRDGVDPMPGALEFVRRMAGKIPMIVATNSATELAEYHLRNLEVLDLFEAVVGVDQVPAGKPAPDIYLRAADKLGVTPSTCVAFEDSVVGSRSAWDSGMFVIGVNADPDISLSAHARRLSLAELNTWQPELTS